VAKRKNEETQKQKKQEAVCKAKNAKKNLPP
jgi:hypothetical protein